MSDTAPAVSVEVDVDEGRAVIRCGRCGVEQVLWTRVDLAADGLASLFTSEHLRCTPEQRRHDDSPELDHDRLVITDRAGLDHLA